jgi:ribose/xylose/arabinose/galactoside ABC-type transport system permease subunit
MFSYRRANCLNVIDQVTVLAILALGMTGVIIIGGIYRSVCQSLQNLERGDELLHCALSCS